VYHFLAWNKLLGQRRNRKKGLEVKSMSEAQKSGHGCHATGQTPMMAISPMLQEISHHLPKGIGPARNWRINDQMLILAMFPINPVTGICPFGGMPFNGK
jgi:hypothetical protein